MIVLLHNESDEAYGLKFKKMAYFLRFTKDNSEKISFDHFNKKPFDGVCCFQLNSENIWIESRSIAEKDSTYLNFYEGNFEIFEGCFIENNPYGNGVIASKGEVVAIGKMEYNEKAKTYKINTSYENI